MYVLILTLILRAGSSGQGGIAMQEFETKQSCEVAKSTWLYKTKENSRYKVYKGEILALCVKK